jgi:hypothetical protein
VTSPLGFVCLMPAPSTFDDVVQLGKAWFPPNSGPIWRTAFRRSSSTRSGERQDPPLRASVALRSAGWCFLRRRQVSNAFQSEKHLEYGAARAVIARVRNTANIAISSFNCLLVKHVMCHVYILDFLGGNCVEDAGVADLMCTCGGLGRNGTENRLNSIPIRA